MQTFSYETPLKLSRKDEKILIELHKNARIHVSKLAKQTRLSRDIVNYRIDRLIKNNFLHTFVPVVNINKLGLHWCTILMKFQNLPEEVEKKLKSYIEKEDFIRQSQKLSGEWDISVHLNVPDILTQNKILSNLRNITEECLLDYEILRGIKEHKFHGLISGYLSNSKSGYKDISSLYPFGRFDENVSQEKFDKIDLDLMNILAENSRMPLIDIAKKLNLSPDSTQKRINNLMKKKIIRGFVAMINTPMQGCQMYPVLLQLKNIDEKEKTEIIENLKNNPFICLVLEFSGKYDIWFHIWAKNPGHFDEIFSEIKNNFKNKIKKCTTLLGLGEYKFGNPPFKKV